MILCDEPYLNEPAWSTSGGSPQSLACKNLPEYLERFFFVNSLRRFCQRAQNGGQNSSQLFFFSLRKDSQ